MQQVLNYQEALNSNLAGPAIGCANWLLIDYNRGYADDIESSGLLDVFRVPKFAFHFYKSQEPPHHSRENAVLFIADYWMENADHCVKVFSNCDQVELSLNGKRLGIQSPDTNRYSTNLAHPPFTFTVEQYEPGTLTARGFIDGKVVAQQERRTPGEPHKMQISTNCGDILPAAGRKDVFIVHATIQDRNGTPVPTATQPVTFKLSGPGRLIGINPIDAEAGIAAIVVESSGTAGKLEISAESKGLLPGKPVRIDIK
jgi:beta-galactosidase